MKILAISFDFYPKNSPQSIQISRLIYGLCKEHQVLLVTENNLKRVISEINKEKLTIISVPEAKQSFFPKFIKQILYYLIPFYKTLPDEYNYIIKKGFKIVSFEFEKGYFPDLMVSFGQPMSDHILANKLYARYAIPWISHFSDPWYGNPYSKMFWLTNIMFIRRWESKVLKNSQAIIYTNDYTKKFVLKRYPNEYSKKTFVLPHSYDPIQYTENSSKNQKITIRYIGSLYGGRSPLYLLKAINSLIKDNNPFLYKLQIEFYGYISKFYLKYFNDKRISEIVKYKGIVGYAESIKLMSSADILLSIDAPSKTNLFLPSKLVEYLGAKKMIFGLTDEGPTRDLIEKMGGITAKSNNVDEIAKSLKKIVENDYRFDWRIVSSSSKAYEIIQVQEKFNNIVRHFN
jgi:hypothetical protein